MILVNLTCGRNPWKRASMEDSTFRAFMRDRNFLQSILPISDELNYILQRIFEVNPQLRISIAELQELIVRCSSFTQAPSTSLPPTPPYSPVEKAVSPSAQVTNTVDVPPMDPLPGQQYPPVPVPYFEVLQPRMLPNGLPTPPGSAGCSPQHSPYTFAAKPPVPAVCSPYPSQAGFVPNMPVWPRCGQLISNFNMPRSACFWNHVPAY